MKAYIIQSIFRIDPTDPLKIGSCNWPFIAASDADAIARADRMLTDWEDPMFVQAHNTGNAIRVITPGGGEVKWKSLDPDNPYADWT